MPSLVIPTPKQGGPVTIRLGKHSREFSNPKAAVEWAESLCDERDLLFAVAIRLAAKRPITRGKTLTIDFNSPNILTVGD